jgi:5,10-methenyltetrahydrofolate synthetase
VSETVRWKKEQRVRLRRLREELDPAFRAEADSQIARSIADAVPAIAGGSFAFYWPMPGEPDLRKAAAAWSRAGAAASLPETVRGEPLTFRPWTPGCAMRAGIWNIPVPDTTAEAGPAVLLIPCLGFDSQGYRLGFGGGFYDRTLAARAPRPPAVGVGYSACELPSIRPEAHDIPMDVIVTERSIVWHSPNRTANR